MPPDMFTSREEAVPPRRPLDAQLLAERLAAAGPTWRRLHVVAETGSTNADLLDAARAGASEGAVLVAEHQTTGRGRLDRVWASPPSAGLTFSVLLRPAGVPAARWPWLPLLAGVAVAEAVAAAVSAAMTAPPRVLLKWPNDVLVGDRKVAGILLERADTAGGPAAVLGVGLNVSTTAAELPGPEATSLLLAGCPEPDREALLGAVLHRLDEHYRRWTAAGGDPGVTGLRSAYESRSATLGRQVEVLLPDGRTLTGRAVGLGQDARLLVRGLRGQSYAMAAGDVRHLRQPAAAKERR